MGRHGASDDLNLRGDSGDKLVAKLRGDQGEDHSWRVEDWVLPLGVLGHRILVAMWSEFAPTYVWKTSRRNREDERAAWEMKSIKPEPLMVLTCPIQRDNQ